MAAPPCSSGYPDYGTYLQSRNCATAADFCALQKRVAVLEAKVQQMHALLTQPVAPMPPAEADLTPLIPPSDSDTHDP